MKPLLITFIYLALATVGFIAAPDSGREPKATSTTLHEAYDPAAKPSSSLKVADDGALRDPRDGSTFEDARSKLDNLTSQIRELGVRREFIEGQRHTKAMLEVDRVFLLASKGDLYEFFTEINPTETDAAVLESAFARLAELSPEDAVAIWSDFQRTHGSIHGANRLAEIWAASDPTAAESWVNQIESTEARQLALVGLLTGAMESDLSLVERKITEVDELFTSIDLTQQLARQIEPEAFGSFASRLLEERRDKWEYQNQLVSTLEIWGKRDGKAMLAWLLEQNPGSFQKHVIPRVAQSRAEANPAQFVQEIGPMLSQNDSFSEMAGQAWLQWLWNGEDDDAAMQWFANYGTEMSLPESNHWLPRIGNGEDAARILGLLDQLPDQELKNQAIWIALNEFNSGEPREALELAEGRLADNQNAIWFYSSTLGKMAEGGEPEQAVAWAVENLEEGVGQLRAIQSIMYKWAASEPTRAVAFAESLSPKLRDEALQRISYEWARTDPKKFLQHVSQTVPNGNSAILARHGFWHLGNDKGGETYLEAALSLSGDEVRTAAVSGLFGGWARANLESSSAALQKMEPGPVRDAAITEFASAASTSDREASIIWTMEISAPDKRRTETLKQSRYWLRSEKQKATEWIQSSDLPEDWKSELLEPKK